MSRTFRHQDYWLIRYLSNEIWLRCRDRRLDWRWNIARKPADIIEMERERDVLYRRFGNNCWLPWIKRRNTSRQAWRKLADIRRRQWRCKTKRETQRLIATWRRADSTFEKEESQS